MCFSEFPAKSGRIQVWLEDAGDFLFGKFHERIECRDLGRMMGIVINVNDFISTIIQNGASPFK